MKKLISITLYYLGISYILFRITHRSGTIRAVNYHCTPLKDKNNFEKQLKFFKKHFFNTNLELLDKYFSNELCAFPKKPGIIITFDDGLRSNYDIAINLLEKYNFTGWFCIPVGFVLNPSQDYAEKNSIIYKQNYTDKRYGMNISEIVEIAKKHIIVCHTFSHHRINQFDSQEILNYEITNSKKELEKITKKDICTFCWVGGELIHYTEKGYKTIMESAYKYSFTTNSSLITKNTNSLNLNRTNIESSFPMHLVLFQLTGLMDLLYFTKRNKVKNKFNDK
jgi:peptidoglycan/xylan/chitin deacetylase (PgdA/CDA1 family)